MCVVVKRRFNDYFKVGFKIYDFKGLGGNVPQSKIMFWFSFCQFEHDYVCIYAS